MFKQKKYVFIRSDKEQRITINYEKNCAYTLFHCIEYAITFFYKSLNKLVEKQNDFKQNKSWGKECKSIFYICMVRKILVIITLSLFNKDSKRKL